MLTPSGPKCLEYNARFGDPETQTLLPLLKSDLAEIMMGCVEGKLDEVEVTMENGACAVVVLAAGGYLGEYAQGDEIQMLHRNNFSGKSFRHYSAYTTF